MEAAYPLFLGQNQKPDNLSHAFFEAEKSCIAFGFLVHNRYLRLFWYFYQLNEIYSEFLPV
jgi:hypothetical protein